MNSHPKCETLSNNKDTHTEERTLPREAYTTGDINIILTQESFRQNRDDAL